MSKSRYLSKTYWWGSSLIAIALLVLASSEFQAFIDSLPPEYVGWATGIAGIVTLILRELTKEPVG